MSKQAALLSFLVLLSLSTPVAAGRRGTLLAPPLRPTPTRATPAATVPSRLPPTPTTPMPAATVPPPPQAILGHGTPPLVPAATVLLPPPAGSFAPPVTQPLVPAAGATVGLAPPSASFAPPTQAQLAASPSSPGYHIHVTKSRLLIGVGCFVGGFFASALFVYVVAHCSKAPPSVQTGSGQPQPHSQDGGVDPVEDTARKLLCCCARVAGLA